MIRDLHPHTKPQRTRNPEHIDPRARDLGYEPRDWPVAKVAIGLALLLLFLVVTALGARPLMHGIGPGWPTESALAAHQHFIAPGPQLETAPRLDRERLEAAQQAALHAAPQSIDDAMRAAAERGWHDGGPR